MQTSTCEESVAELVARLVQASTSFRVEEGRLFVKPPPDGSLADADLELVQKWKSAILAHVERLDAAFADALDVLDWARRRHGRTPGVVGVAEEYAVAVRTYHERYDPLLLDAPTTIRAWLNSLPSDQRPIEQVRSPSTPTPSHRGLFGDLPSPN